MSKKISICRVNNAPLEDRRDLTQPRLRDKLNKKNNKLYLHSKLNVFLENNLITKSKYLQVKSKHNNLNCTSLEKNIGHVLNEMR